MGVPLSSRRHLAIAGVVVLFHVAALWALQTGLIRRVVEVFVPVVVLSELIEPPRPHVEPPPPAPKPMAPTAPRKIESLPPPPMPLAMADPAPAINAPASVMAPPMAAPVAAAPPRIELPSSNADYLQNPKPAYPAMSKRLGEQGKVVVRVLIGVDGVAQKAEIRQSSGFDRLDQAAWTTAQRWRYVPGKRGGVPEAMWVNVPINFVLE
ncbi:MAG: energy transducer TonB [Polaromonas sp.]|nr:energy transducer TonB [Polaromonas sp.]